MYVCIYTYVYMYTHISRPSQNALWALWALVRAGGMGPQTLNLRVPYRVVAFLGEGPFSD